MREICEVCSRFHESDKPCSQRIANAHMMRPQALEQLTDADKEWMTDNPIDVSDILEEELAERMGLIS